MNTDDTPLLPHGGYRKLRSYKVAEAVYDSGQVRPVLRTGWLRSAGWERLARRRPSLQRGSLFSERII